MVVTGVQILDLPTVSNYEILTNNTEYAKIFIRKASVTTNYQQSFTRIDSTLSYIGGIFGLITIIMYGMKAYSEYSY
jgi:hypothetical protein